MFFPWSLRYTPAMASPHSERTPTLYPSTIRIDDELALSLVQEGDAVDIFEATDGDRKYLREWLPWVDGTRSVEDTRRFVLRSLEQVRQTNGFQARIDYRGQFAGVVGYLYHDWVDRRTEIGYWLREALQGRGVMTRACRVLVNLAFDSFGFNRIEIRAATDNRRSSALAERLGFVREGVLREAAWLNDHYIDLIVYSKLQRDRGIQTAGEVRAT